MTDAQKKALVKTLVGNDAAATDDLVGVYLSDAEEAIMRRLYRVYGDIPEAVSMPAMYERLQCKLSARYFLRRGGEGEISHSENGVARNYGSVNDEDLLMEVIPYARVM